MSYHSPGDIRLNLIIPHLQRLLKFLEANNLPRSANACHLCGVRPGRGRPTLWRGLSYRQALCRQQPALCKYKRKVIDCVLLLPVARVCHSRAGIRGHRELSNSSKSFALSRARGPILVVLAIYLLSLLAGIVMAHSGNKFALSYRDSLVSAAQSGAVLTQKSRLDQGLADFGSNSLGAGIVTPFPMVVYRGWVGGIVSVDSHHSSRLTQPKQAAYYFSVVLLQLLGYSLAAGAGIHAGLSIFRARPKNAGLFWYRIPRQAMLDVLWIYALVLPIFLTASLWEFLSSWN